MTIDTVRAGATALAALLLSFPSPGPATEAPPPSLFRDVTRESGIDFVHHSAPEKKFILESMSGGLAVLDFDGDGLLDVYLVNSLTVDTADRPETAPSALYRNLGGGRFEDVARRAGVAFPGWGVGACGADVDGDGFPDLYVTGVERNRFYRNRGDGTFEEASDRLGIAGGGWSAGCGFADYDRDGDLDLFVSRYVKMDLADLPEFGSQKTCQYRGIPVQCGPRGLPGTSDLLYRNDGDAGFTEVGAQAGVGDPDGYFGMGIAWVDLDRDGWLDLYVANDSNPNFLYRNRGDGTFEETAFPLGIAVSEDGAEQGGMGVAVGDVRNRGRFDLFVTNFSEEYNAFYRDEGSYFADVSFRSATAPPSLPYVGWGTAFFDYDQDGWLDLVAVNGHVYPQLETADLGASAAYRQRKLLYRNQGDGTFREVTDRAPPLLEKRVSRGLVPADLDGDGRLDLVINDLDGPAQILRNEADGGSSFQVDLVGRSGNRNAIGAVVSLKVDDQTQTRLVRSGTGYLSQEPMRLHFGVGEAKRIDRLAVHWPDGSRSVAHDLPAGRVVRFPHPQP